MTSPNTGQDYLNAPDWNSIAAASLTSAPTVDGNTLNLELDVGQCHLQVFADGIRLFSNKQREYNYGMLVNEIEPLQLELSPSDNAQSVDEDSSSIIKAADLIITIKHTPFAFEVTDLNGRTVSQSPTDGHFVRRHRVPPLAKTDQGWLFCHDLKSNEPIYGLGEKWGKLDKRGQLLRSYNCDALGVNAEVSYKNTPFCWSPQGWGILAHTPAIVTHAVGHPSWSQRTYCCLIEDEVLDLFLFIKPRINHPNTGSEIIGALNRLTGFAPLPPNWSGGVILSKAYYQDPKELLAVAKEVRARNMPCDTITIDGRAWQDTDTRFAFEWDKTRWPDPKPVLDELKAMGFKICIWEYPLVSTQHAWFKKFADNGWLLKDKRTGEAYQYDWDQQAFGRVLTALPKSGIVDFTQREAYEFWRDAHKELFEMGIDMIKADFGEQLEDDNMLAANGETGLALHNVYAHLYNKCVYEAAEKYSPNGPFLFSRASWIGCQRFNSQWGGDPQADWEGMMGNIRGGISWGLSGAPFYATDVGGFYKDTRDDALYVRWAQAAVFSAHYRLHGIGAREPWSYSSAADNAVMQALTLRYQLQSYLQNAMQQATETGLPVQRAMVLAFPNEKQAWGFENQFMFGEDILVAPCFEPSGDVEYYLPAGDWVNLNQALNNADKAEVKSGGVVYSETLNLNDMAVFIRKGVSLPINDPVENTDQIKVNAQGRFIAAKTLSV